MTDKHLSIGPSSFLAPVPVVLVSAACSKKRLRKLKAEDELDFAAQYKEALGHLYDEIELGDEHDLVRTITCIAWVGTVSSQPPRVSVSVRSGRLLYALAKISGYMMIYPIAEHFIKEADFCGVKSGREIDKFEYCGFDTYDYQSDPERPVYAEAPIVLACKIEQSLNLDSHDCFISVVEEVLVKESLMDKKGKVHLNRAKLIAYAHGEYYALGSVLGFFGFSLASPSVLQRRMPKR